MRTSMHETEHQPTWSCCQWNSVPTLSTRTKTCLNKRQECSHIFCITFRNEPVVLVSFISQFWMVFLKAGPITPELCLSYCHMMTEGTFRVTPLLSCQLVSGDILHSYLLFVFTTEVWTSRKVTPRICHYTVDLIYVFLKCVLAVVILWKRGGIHIFRI